MKNQKLYEAVGKYIDQYYIKKPDDIRRNKERKFIFDRISELRKKKTGSRSADDGSDVEIEEHVVGSF